MVINRHCENSPPDKGIGANTCSWVCKSYSSTLVGNCIQLDLELLGGHHVIVCNQEIINLIEWLEVKY